MQGHQLDTPRTPERKVPVLGFELLHRRSDEDDPSSAGNALPDGPRESIIEKLESVDDHQRTGVPRAAEAIEPAHPPLKIHVDTTQSDDCGIGALRQAQRDTRPTGARLACDDRGQPVRAAAHQLPFGRLTSPTEQARPAHRSGPRTVRGNEADQDVAIPVDHLQLHPEAQPTGRLEVHSAPPTTPAQSGGQLSEPTVIRGIEMIQCHLVGQHDPGVPQGHHGTPVAPGDCGIERGQQPSFGIAGIRQQSLFDLRRRRPEKRTEQGVLLARRPGEGQYAFESAGHRIDDRVAVAAVTPKRLREMLAAGDGQAPAQLERSGDPVGPGGILGEPPAEHDPRAVEDLLDAMTDPATVHDSGRAVGEHGKEGRLRQLIGDSIQHRQRGAHEPAVLVDFRGLEAVERQVRTHAGRPATLPRTPDLGPGGLW